MAGLHGARLPRRTYSPDSILSLTSEAAGGGPRSWKRSAPPRSRLPGAVATGLGERLSADSDAHRGLVFSCGLDDVYRTGYKWGHRALAPSEQASAVDAGSEGAQVNRSAALESHLAAAMPCVQ